MNAHYKKLWIEALRSGKYKQGKYTLRNKKDEFCCLGVLCDIMEPNNWIESDTKFYHDGEGGLMKSNSSHLPKSICKKADITPSGDYQYESGAVLTLMGHNDTGDSFWQIANIIEKYF